MSKLSYKVMFSRPNKFSRWFDLLWDKEANKIICCDCGLAHYYNFRIVEREGKQVLQFQGQRDKRATSAIRRWDRYRAEKKSKQD